MTTPTTNYGWAKPLTTDPANIAGINTVIDDIETDISTIATNIGAIIRPMGMMKLIAQSVICNNATAKYLASTDWWEQSWFVNGNVDGSPTGTQPIVMNTDGTWKVTAAGVYRLTYHLNFLCYSTPVEGYWFASVYKNSDNSMVERTTNAVRMQTHYPSFQTMHHSTLLRATSGGDIELSTLYKLGVTQDASSTVVLTTRYDQADNFYSYYTLEYVRGL